jgi:type II secretory pathway component PulF
MFTYYDGKVYDIEYFNSPEPSNKDLVFFAQTIWTQIEMGIPVLRALIVANKITPNKKVRRTIEEIIGDLETGENISKTFFENLNNIDINMLKKINKDNDYINEIINNLREYTINKVDNPNYISSEIIGRSVELISFTHKMHKNLSEGLNIFESLKNSKVTTSERFIEITSQLPELYLEQESLAGAIYHKFDDEFDYLWVNIIDAGEEQKNSYKGIKKAFEILSGP